MKIKKHQIIILHAILLLGLALLVVKYVEEIKALKESVYYAVEAAQNPETVVEPDSLRPVKTNGDEWFIDHPLIYHAGGAVDGGSYTNAVEAVENTLREGNRFIELDFRYTSDHQLICIHDWKDAFLEDKELTLEEFAASKIQGKFTPLTAEHLIEIMREHTDMYLVTDVKDKGCIDSVITDLVLLAGEDASVLDRFIIQLYTGREKSSIQEIYPFKDEQFLFTIYNWGRWSLEVPQICNEENISVITVPYGEIPDEDVSLVRELGFTVYEHTVNRADEARKSLKRGISGFYTDFLSQEDLEP